MLRLKSSCTIDMIVSSDGPLFDILSIKDEHKLDEEGGGFGNGVSDNVCFRWDV